mmetsp:Transcript_412/g.890  ORF Transcript_412/g.890 Transcript_412/m.890 type:complete len:538 (-) Transcript_412:134-1747(-)
MRLRPLLLLLLPCSALGKKEAGKKDVTIDSFDPASHEWMSVNDPVMGGQSSGSFTLRDGAGVFEGEVRDVPSLGAPGFIAVRTPRTGSWFPDLRSCDGLRLRVRSDDYGGYRLSFGTNFAGTMPYAHGYKAPFSVAPSAEDKDGEFRDVELKFADFSDNWDPRTGDVVVSCASDGQYCPDDATLRNMVQMEVMAEGVNGKVKLEIDSIAATNCDDDVVETDPDPDATNRNGGSGRPRGQFGGRNYSGALDREKNAVGGFGGYMHPTILPNGDIRIESFDDPRHRWYTINDPVMGGKSDSTVSVKSDAGVFDGTVRNVETLDAPGFVKMETRGGSFPDVSACKALRMVLKSDNGYGGLRVTFGRHHNDGAPWYIRGYKAHLPDVPTGRFTEVVMPFEDFSDKWDPRTGDVLVSCKEDRDHCVDDLALTDMATFSIMGEGVGGPFHVEIKSIDATGCKHSKAEYQDENAFKGNGLSAFAISSILVGFVAVGAASFFVGRGFERRVNSRYVEPPEVVADGISLPPSPSVEVGGTNQDMIT